MNQAKNRVYYIQDLKRLFASTSQTGVEGLMGFNALQSLEKKGIVKTLKRKGIKYQNDQNGWENGILD